MNKISTAGIYRPAFFFFFFYSHTYNRALCRHCRSVRDHQHWGGRLKGGYNLCSNYCYTLVPAAGGKGRGWWGREAEEEEERGWRAAGAGGGWRWAPRRSSTGSGRDRGEDEKPGFPGVLRGPPSLVKGDDSWEGTPDRSSISGGQIW